MLNMQNYSNSSNTFACASRVLPLSLCHRAKSPINRNKISQNYKGISRVLQDSK